MAQVRRNNIQIAPVDEFDDFNQQEQIVVSPGTSTSTVRPSTTSTTSIPTVSTSTVLPPGASTLNVNNTVSSGLPQGTSSIVSATTGIPSTNTSTTGVSGTSNSTDIDFQAGSGDSIDSTRVDIRLQDVEGDPFGGGSAGGGTSTTTTTSTTRYRCMTNTATGNRCVVSTSGPYTSFSECQAACQESPTPINDCPNGKIKNSSGFCVCPEPCPLGQTRKDDTCNCYPIFTSDSRFTCKTISGAGSGASGPTTNVSTAKFCIEQANGEFGSIEACRNSGCEGTPSNPTPTCVPNGSITGQNATAACCSGCSKLTYPGADQQFTVRVCTACGTPDDTPPVVDDPPPPPPPLPNTWECLWINEELGIRGCFEAGPNEGPWSTKAQCEQRCANVVIPDPTCPGSQKYINGRCQCGNVCADGSTPTGVDCKCGCDKSKVSCANGNFYVDNNCNCKCGLTSQQCKSGETYDPINCVCRPRGCTKACDYAQGFVLDEGTCTCRCRKSCGAGTVLNRNTCECESDCTNLNCPSGFTPDYSNCNCRCNKTCPAGYRITGNCQCEKIITPPPFDDYGIINITTEVKCEIKDCMQPEVYLETENGTGVLTFHHSGNVYGKLPASVRSRPFGTYDKTEPFRAKLTNFVNKIFVVPPGNYRVVFKHNNICPDSTTEYINPTSTVLKVGRGQTVTGTGKYTCIIKPTSYWLKPIDRKAENVQEKVVKGLFADNVTNLITYYTHSVDSETDRYVKRVYNRHPITGVTSSAHFSLAYGHYLGYGSNDNGGQYTDTPTKAIYGQYRNLILSGSTQKFNLTGTTTDHIYVINYQKGRVKDEIDVQAFELNLAYLSGSEFIAGQGGGDGPKARHTGSNVSVAGNGVLRLTTDYIPSINSNPEVTAAGKVYNIVSGSIEDGIYNSSSPHYYGKIYPNLRVVLLDANKLDLSASFGTVNLREVEGDNHTKLFYSLSGSALLTDTSGDFLGMKARVVDYNKKSYYFMTANNWEFNRSNNYSYRSGSKGDIVADFKDSPKTYVTTVGLYNDNRELLAVGKFSKPILKTALDEANITVKV